MALRNNTCSRIVIHPEIEFLRKAYNNGACKYADVILKSIDNENHRGHRVILATRSKCFERLLDGIQENAQQEDGLPILQLDITAQHLKTFLDYIYCGTKTRAASLDLYRQAHFFELDQLKREKLLDSVSSENALQMLKFAKDYSAHRNKKAALDHIRADPLNVGKAALMNQLDLRNETPLAQEEKIELVMEIMDAFFKPNAQ